MTTEVQPLTKETIIGWSATEMLKNMQDPTMRAEIERVWNSAEVDEAQATADAAAEEAKRLADEAAAKEQADAVAAVEAQRLAEEAARVEVAKTPVYKKLVVEYQATDPITNTPIGRPTHLETTYIEGDVQSEIAAYKEMSEKQKTAHINATQALENIKKQKVTFKEPVEPPKVGLTEEEIKQLAAKLDDDPAKGAEKVEAIRKLSNAEAAEEREREAQAAKAAADAEKESYAFMKAHLQDFVPCQANSDILTTYMTENNLAWTKDNLEIAFAATESQLAPPSKPAASVPPAEPAAPVVQAPPVTAEVVPVTPAVPSVVTAPAAAPVASPANPATPPKVPNSGVEPGTLRGSPPVTAPATGPTKRDILKMPRDEYKQKIKDPKFRALVNALFAEKTSA